MPKRSLRRQNVPDFICLCGQNLLGRQFFCLLKFQCIFLAVTSSTYLNY